MLILYSMIVGLAASDRYGIVGQRQIVTSASGETFHDLRLDSTANQIKACSNNRQVEINPTSFSSTKYRDITRK